MDRASSEGYRRIVWLSDSPVGIPPDSLSVRISNDFDHLGVDLVVFIDQATTPDAVPTVGSAQVGSDAARVLPQSPQLLGPPSSIVAKFLGVPDRHAPRSVRPQDRHPRTLVPRGEMRDRVLEILKTQHVNERLCRLDNFHRQRRVGFVAVAQNQVIGVVSSDRVVSDLVILCRQRRQFLTTGFRFELRDVEQRTLPLVVSTNVQPGRTVNVEVSSLDVG